MKQKTLSILLAVLMSMVVHGVYAHDFEVNGIYYTITSTTDKTVAVTYWGRYYYSKKYYGSVTIPETVTYNGTSYGVTSIGTSAFYECSGLTSVIIGNSVTSIGRSAFNGCSGLTSLSIGNGVTSIGDQAFYGCRGLTSVTIPDGVTSIGNDAFYGCSGLASVTIPDGVTSIGSSAFYNCSGLTSVTIPESVTSIGDQAFYGCSGLTSLSIGNGVTSIGDQAFYGCRGLTSVTIPESVTSIGDQAFYNCSGLASVTINSNAVASKSYTSSNCFSNIFGSQVREYVFGKEVECIGEYACYGCRGLTSVTIPESVTSIGNDAFYGCSGLASVTIPDGVTSIGSSAFYNCSGLTSLSIGNGVTSIGDQAFYGCRGLTSVTIPDGVTSIGNDAFYGCSGLTNLIIPNKVIDIGNYAFSGCKGLTTLTIPNNVRTIGQHAFSGCGLNLIILGRGVVDLGFYVFSGNPLKDIYCYAVNVPRVVDGTKVGKLFEDSYTSQVTLHVPSVALTAYKTTEPWSKIGKIVPVEIPVEALLLDTHKLTCDVGTQRKFTCSFTPYYADNKNINWTSSDNNLITIDENGTMTAIRQGTVWVKATSEDNPEAKDSCFVTIYQSVKGITLSHNEYALKGIGKSIRLEAAVHPSDATNTGVTWSSSNESVCTVKDGLVTAKGKGTAIITVRTDDGGFTASCTITVTQAVTGITLNYESYTLNNVGESVQLTATVTPEDAGNKTVKWASLNENVCRVVDGYVLATGEGVAVITATAVDGDVSAKCTVTVKVPKAATGVTLDKETLILHAIGESAQLTASVLPDDAGNKNVTWTTSNDAVCMVSNTGMVVATGEGSAVITVKTEDGGFTATCNVKVSISHPVTGVTLNQESITFDAVGKTLQLVATVVPDDATEKSVTWTSSNESVCMVSSNGFIVAVGYGSSVITATTVDGGYTATCQVTVEDKTPVESVTAKAMGYKVFDLQGREHSRLQKGLNILRLPDGTTKKVLIK